MDDFILGGVEPEPAVDFLQFNREVFAEPENGGGTIFHDFLNRIRVMDADGRIEGFETPGAFISTAWPYIFGIAGIILFAMLLWGSMEIMFGAATPKSAESGKTRITYAIIGFVILFMVFWIGQIIQQIFGINFGLGPMPTT